MGRVIAALLILLTAACIPANAIDVAFYDSDDVPIGRVRIEAVAPTPDASPTEAPDPTPTQIVTLGIACNRDSFVKNLRAEASVTSSSMGSLQPGECQQIIGTSIVESRTWYLLCIGGLEDPAYGCLFTPYVAGWIVIVE